MTFTALSVIQPWPWAILRPDVSDPAARTALQSARLIKDCENREWETPVRGWVLLHASSTRPAKWDYKAAQLFAAKRGVELPPLYMRESLPYGAVVGAVRVDDCRWGYRSPWYTGPRAFVFGVSVPFAVPVPCAGAPRFFQLPQDGGASVGGAELAQQLAAAVVAAGLARAFRLPGEAGERPVAQLVDREDFRLQ